MSNDSENSESSPGDIVPKPVLDYAPPEEPTRRIALFSDRRSLKRWIWLNGSIVLFFVLLALGFMLWVTYVNRLQKVADIPAPSGNTTKYELCYGRFGDLVFRKQGDSHELVFWDYYPADDIKVVKVDWPTDDRIVIRLQDDTELDIRVSALSSDRRVPGRPATRNTVP